jgi:hypothetical protein
VAAAGAGRRAEDGGTVLVPFAGVRVPLMGQRTAVERSGCGALRRDRLPGRFGEWRPASSRLPFLPLSPLSDFVLFPEYFGRSRVRVL